MNGDQETKIAGFIDVTGAERADAIIFLESVSWDYGAAVDAYFETYGNDQQQEGFVEQFPNPDFDQPSPANRLSPFAQRQGEQRQERDEPSPLHQPRFPSPTEEQDDSEVEIIGERRPVRNMTGRGAEEPRKFATLFDSSRVGSKGDDDDDDKNNRQAFYVGGGDKSGQEVLGPDRSSADKVESFFRRVRNLGAEEMAPADSPLPSNSTSSSSFTGVGHRLDGTAVDGDEKPRPVQTVRLRMWRNGFTVDDEPLRSYEAPENKAFLESVVKGVIPHELTNKYPGAEVSLEMENLHQQDCEEPGRDQPRVVPFSGQGFILGNPCPTVAGAGQVGTKISPRSPSKPVNEPAKIDLDPNEPTTNVTVRLVDGSRLVLRLNHGHTVYDIRNYVCKCRPEYAMQRFVFMTSYPSKAIDDEQATLAEANLLNSVIIQRLK